MRQLENKITHCKLSGVVSSDGRSGCKLSVTINFEVMMLYLHQSQSQLNPCLNSIPVSTQHHLNLNINFNLLLNLKLYLNSNWLWHESNPILFALTITALYMHNHSCGRDLRDQFFTFETMTEKNSSHKTRLRTRMKELWSPKTRPIPRLMIDTINFCDQDWNWPRKTQLAQRCLSLRVRPKPNRLAELFGSAEVRLWFGGTELSISKVQLRFRGIELFEKKVPLEPNSWPNIWANLISNGYKI